MFLRYPVFGFLRFASISVFTRRVFVFFAQMIILSLDPWVFLCLFFVTRIFFDIRGLDFCIFVGWCFSPDASFRFIAQIIINRLITPLFFRPAGAGWFFVYGPFLVCKTVFFSISCVWIFAFLLQFFIRRISRFPVV